jgi:hypothetical protein
LLFNSTVSCTLHVPVPLALPQSFCVKPFLTHCSDLVLGLTLGCFPFSFMFKTLLWNSVFILESH